MSNEHEIKDIKKNEEFFNPLYEHGSREAADQKNTEWLTFARTHPELMDTLSNVSDNELEGFRQLIEMFSVKEVIGMIRMFIVMRDVANGKLDVNALLSDAPGEADPNTSDEAVSDE